MRFKGVPGFLIREQSTRYYLSLFLKILYSGLMIRHCSNTILLGAALLLGITPLSSAVAKKEPLVLKPSGKWILSYDEDGCRMLRQFGEGDEKTIFSMSRYAPSLSFSMLVAGKPVRTRRDQKSSNIRFEPTGSLLQVPFFSGDLGELPAMVFSGSGNGLYTTEDSESIPDVAIRASQNGISALSIGSPLRRDVRLDLGLMEKPFAAMEQCTDDLVTSWGLNPETQKSLREKVTPLVERSKWIRPSDYPSDMLQAGQPALVTARIMIDREGQITGCHIQRTTRPKEFDKAVCGSIIRRAKFSPAINADGETTASYYIINIRFQIP
ncbi:TonB family protein [Alterisphingorhabdus coralli]|uniref:TonB family protein n=1 Tax=Alterisphingorhabdus coralli TaxID=3071408 RepID=A0AA97I163_9SPHN|nr:TonB family protein [Parasphingorhabdus sp. SCSIO 66989]WOE75737.1 TonB family protein [Parasphingorhabdus sp. SCSIO 66989]